MEFSNFINGYYDVENQLNQYILRKAEEYFKNEDQDKKGLKTIEQFEQRRDRIKKYFIDAIGGLEFDKTPLKAVCTGAIEKKNYHIKKIIFQSQPGIYVTCNLYIPNNLKDRAPGILFAHGHSEIAKSMPIYQKVCIDLVTNGFIVLAVDPIGQGERKQYYEKTTGHMMIEHSIIEHSYTGLQCELAGSNIIRYFVWDLIRALDYLCDLPEVDETRIGMTGCSGGGTQTSYMMLLDDRIKTAVPCTYITSRESWMKTGQAHDAEQNIFGAISEGLNYDDFVSCFAPKPVLIGAVESDFFCIEGTVQSYERAKHIYDLFGCGESVQLYVGPGIHTYSDELRQQAVNWFKEHLKGEEGNFITEPNMSVEDMKDLWCTSCGQVVGEFDDARTIFDLNVDYMKQNTYVYTEELDIIKQKLISLLNMPKSCRPMYPRTIETSKYGDADCDLMFFFAEEDLTVSGIYMSNPAEKDKSQVCTILLLEDGTNDIVQENALVNKCLNDGDVFVFDPRGIGAVKSRKVNNKPYYRMYGTEFKLAYDALMLKQTLAGLRVYDILKACELIRELYPGKQIRLAGKGISAIYTLFAGVLNDDINNIYLENMLQSFEDIVTTKYYDFNINLQIYGILKELDLPLIVKVFQNKKIVNVHVKDPGINARPLW